MADDVRRLRVEIVGGREAEQQLDRLIAKRNQLFGGGPTGGGGGGRITAIGDPGSSIPAGSIQAGAGAVARITGPNQRLYDQTAAQMLDNVETRLMTSAIQQLQQRQQHQSGNRARDVMRATGVPPRMAGSSGRSSARDLEFEGPEDFDESLLSPETRAIVRATRSSARRSAIIRAFRGAGGEPGAAFSPRGRALTRLTAGIAAEDFARQPTDENLERLLERRTLPGRAAASATLDRQASRAQQRNVQAEDAIARARAAVDDASLNPRVRLGRIQEGITAARGQARAGFGDFRDTAEQLVQDRARVNDEVRQAARAPRATPTGPTRPGGGVFGAGPFGDFNQAAFGPGIAALSLTFGLAPLFQGNQALLNANRQFGPFNQERGALNTERTLTLTALGGQADAAQRNIDRLTNQILRLAAAANLGGPLNVAARGGEAAAGILNVVSPIAGGVAALGAARAARAAAAAATGGAAEGAAAGLFGGGLGAGLVGAGRGLLGGLARFGGPAAAVIASNFVTTGTPFSDANAFNDQQIRQSLQGLRPQAASPTAVVPGLPPDISTIIARQAAEAQRANNEPARVAAEQELLQRTEARAGLESQRTQLRLSRFQIDQSERFTREDQARDQFRLALGLGQQFEDIQTARRRQGEDIAIQSRRAREGVAIQREQQGEDIATGTARAREDLAIRTSQAREDVSRSLGRSFRELDISAGQSREDVERGFGEGVQDLIFGQIGGIGGGLLRLGLQRQRGLDAIDRNVARQRGALTRGAGDQNEDIGIAEQRGEASIGLGEDRAVKDADLQAKRAGQGIDRAEQQAVEDADLQVKRQIDDAILNYTRQTDALAAAQQIQTERTQQNNAIMRAVLDEQERQLNRQLTINTGIGNTLADLQAMLTSEIEARKTFQTELDQLIPRMGDVRRRLASLPG